MTVINSGQIATRIDTSNAAILGSVTKLDHPILSKLPTPAILLFGSTPVTIKDATIAVDEVSNAAGIWNVVAKEPH